MVLDTTLYWIPCPTVEAANYLTAIINSRALATALSPLMPKGQFGARHVHKHLWRLPIPEYDPGEDLHRGIAVAGAITAEGATMVMRDVRATRERVGKATSMTVARREIRAWLEASEQGQIVERLVSSLLA